MNHKEKCKFLKEIRKNLADKLGIDLHQRECTYKGDCPGTCPKCREEEKLLNRVLLSGAAATAGIALSACGAELEESGGSVKERSTEIYESISETKEANEANELIPDDLTGEVAELEGDVEYTGEPVDLEGETTEYPREPVVLEGETTEYPGEPVELEGDVAYENPLEDEAFVLEICKKYTGAPFAEVDSYGDDYSLRVHCYDVIDDGNGTSHTDTYDWIDVDIFAETMTSELNGPFDYMEYRD